MSLVVFTAIMGLHNIEEKLFNKISHKFETERTILPIVNMYLEEYWIVDASYGRSAIFLYEVPLRSIAMIHSKSLEPNTKFRFINERYGNPYILTIASSRKLPKEFRDQLNLK